MLTRIGLVIATVLTGAYAAWAGAGCAQFELKPGSVWQIRNACNQTIAVTRWDQGACKGGCTVELGPKSTQQIPAPEGRYDWTEEKR